MRALSLAGKLLVGAECLGLEVVGGQRKQRLPRELMLCEQKEKGGVDDSPRRHSTNKQAGSSKVGGCERMSALTFLSRPAFLLSAFSSFTGLSPGSSTVCDHMGTEGLRCLLPSRKEHSPEQTALLADFSLLRACTGLRCPGSSEAASMEGLGIEGSEWQGAQSVTHTCD